MKVRIFSSADVDKNGMPIDLEEAINEFLAEVASKVSQPYSHSGVKQYGKVVTITQSSHTCCSADGGIGESATTISIWYTE